MKRIQSLTFALLGSLIAHLDLNAVTNPVGGGILDSGLQGTWYSDNSFASPAFERRDLRLDFDWGELRKPGGSLPWTRLGQLAADNYSVRWEGRLMTRFSETYTLTAYADSVRVWIKAATDADYPATPLIDYWPASDPGEYLAQSATFAFEAGAAYDIKIEYRERTGPAMMRLLWASPSTPMEVIQPTAMVGDIPPQRGVILADAVQSATNWGENMPSELSDGTLALDADGWPMEDFSFVLRPTDRTLHLGTYLLSFKGSARVAIGVGGGELRSADGAVSYGSQTSATDGYDPATNTTTLRVVISNDTRDAFWPRFTETDRDGPDNTTYGTYSGLTDVRMLRPSGIGSDTPHDTDELFAREALDTLETFVTFRWNDVNGTSDANPDGDSIGLWEHRRQWEPNTSNTSFTGENHEYKILLSNHSGRDLYIQVPHLATDDYITKMAQLIAFGANADGIPYTSTVADPHFPPLNPNLRVNVEYANEIPWNTAGQYPQGNWARVQPEVRRQAWLADPTSSLGQSWEILNFDNLLATDNNDGKAEGLTWGKRFTALRTVELSDIFRTVFGDDAMQAPGKQDPRVRVLYMYQYDNANGTATDAFNFIDGYFNKVHPASTYSGDPKPVPYFIYGGGAATYYASADRHGALYNHPFVTEALGTFETPLIAPGVAAIAPAGSAWTFTGTAGIYREAERFAGTYGSIPSPDKNVDDFNNRGMRITVGPQDVAIYEVGRYVHDGNSGEVSIAIYEADAPHTSLFSRTFSINDWPAGGTAWQRTGRNIFIISNKAYGFPIILEAGKSYYIVATESATGNSHSAETEFVPPPGVTVDGAVLGRNVSGTWTWQLGSTPNRTYGPVNFKLAPAPISTDTGVSLGFLQDSKNGMEDSRSLDNRYFSPQAAFIAGQGSMEIDITFPAPGVYGLIYSLAHKPNQTPYAETATNGANPPMMFLLEDGAERNISASGQEDQLPSINGWSHEGYWTKPNTGYDFFGSAPFEITDISKSYRIRIVGTQASTDRVVLIDNVILGSADKMTEGEIPSGGGFAEGAPDVSNWEARVMSMYKYAQSFGLRAMSYEGGWYPGGDANKMPLQFASSFFAEAMVQGEMNAINALNRAGLVVNTDYTLNFALPDYGVRDPDAYRRIQAWRTLNAGLPAEPTNGQTITSFFTASGAWLSHNVTDATMADGGWFAWNVIVPETGLYDFQLETTGSGTVSVRVNEAHVPILGSAGGSLTSTTSVFLPKGLHSMRVLTQGGSATLVSLGVTDQVQLPGFNGLVGAPGNAEVYLSWPSVASATGYHVYYKSRLASTFTRFTTTPITSPEQVVTGLLNNSTYNFVVTYVDGVGTESAYSNQVTVVPSEEALILAWEFDDSTDKQVQSEAGLLTPRAQSPNLATGINLVSGAWKGFDTNSYMVKDSAGFGGGWSFVDLELRDDHYIGFAVTPVDGVRMRLTELRFGLWWSMDNDDPVNLLNCELRVSTDGFATYSTAPLSPDPTSVPFANGNTSTGKVISADLSGISALRSLQAGTHAEFRIHFFGTGINYWGIGKLGDSTDDVLMYGFPVDPEAVEAPTASPDAGTYAAPLTVNLSTITPGAQIRYTLDDSTPGESNGTLIAGTSGEVVLSESTTLRAIAFADGMTPSNVLTRSYTIAPVTAAPQFSIASGTYDGPQLVALSTTTSLAEIRYTLDGSTPSADSGLLYTGPLTVAADTTIRAIALRSGFVPSAISSASYTIVAAPGTVSFYSDAVDFAENGGDLVLNVRRLDGRTGNISVDYSTVSGTAIAGEAFTATSGTLQWGDGDITDKLITIPILDNALGHGDMSFTVTLSDPVDATLGSPATVTVTILDDDTPIITFTADSNPRINVPISLQADIVGIGNVTSEWSVISGPGVLSIADPSASSTTALTSTEGSYVVRLTATDDLRTNVKDLTIAVAWHNVAPTLDNAPAAGQAIVGEPFQFTFAADTFTDLEDSTLAYTLTRSNGGPLPAWLSFDASTRSLSGTPPPIAAGTLNLRLTATDSGDASANTAWVLTIFKERTLVALLQNDFSSVTSGLYASGQAFGSDALLGVSTGRSADTSEVYATGGTGNSPYLGKSPSLRSSTTIPFRDEPMVFQTRFRFDPTNTTTGGFIGFGIAHENSVDDDSIMWDLGDRILVGLERTDATTQTVRFAHGSRFNGINVLAVSEGDVGSAQLIEDDWYALSFEFIFNYNAAEPSQSTITVRNLTVQHCGTDGTLSGDMVLSLNNTTFNPAYGDGLDAVDRAFVLLGTNGARGCDSLDAVMVQKLQLVEQPSPFNTWAEGIVWPSGSDPSPAGIVNRLGISNLMAFALNADPTDPTLARLLPAFHSEARSGETNLLHLTTRQRTGEHGLTYAVLGSADLSTWDPVTPTVTVLDPDFDGDGTTQLLRYSVPMPAPNPDTDPKLFLRLSVQP